MFAEMKALRSQRPNMVNNKQQYLFAHLVLVECLLCSSTSLPCDESLPLKIKKVKEQLVTQRDRYFSGSMSATIQSKIVKYKDSHLSWFK